MKIFSYLILYASALFFSLLLGATVSTFTHFTISVFFYLGFSDAVIKVFLILFFILSFVIFVYFGIRIKRNLEIIYYDESLLSKVVAEICFQFMMFAVVSILMFMGILCLSGIKLWIDNFMGRT